MRILFLGDVVGRSGRAAVTERLAGLKRDWKVDFAVVNGENATSGAGITAAHAKTLLDAGADCLTLGDHAFDQRDMLQFIETEPRILRPLNFAKAAPGKGARVFEASGSRKVLVAQVLGQVFMKRPFDDPFSAIEPVLKAHPPGGLVQASLVEMHCEATSEKMAMGHWCDGRASAMVGTHTHVPTADAMILPRGTAYHDRRRHVRRLQLGHRHGKGRTHAPLYHRHVEGSLQSGEWRGDAVGALIETDDRTGKATRISDDPGRRIAGVSLP